MINVEEKTVDWAYTRVQKSFISQIYPWYKSVIDFAALLIPQINNDRLCEVIKKKFLVDNLYLLDSGTSALKLGLLSLNLKKGDEVLLTALNCESVINAVVDSGASPVFVDINKSGGLDLSNVAESISERTKAVIVTHIYGNRDRVDEIADLCRKRSIYCINDLAQIFENFDSDERLNKYGDFGIYSFGPEKHLFALGGGALFVNNKSLLDGINREYDQLKVISKKKVESVFLCRCVYYAKFFINRYFPSLINFTSHKNSADKKISDNIVIQKMHASQLFSLKNKLDSYSDYQNKSLDNYCLLKEHLKGIKFLNTEDKTCLPLYLNILVEGHKRYHLSTYLDNEKIATVWNYVPLYKYDIYRKYLIKGNENIENVWHKVISIPFRYPLKKSFVMRVSSVINNYRKEYGDF